MMKQHSKSTAVIAGIITSTLLAPLFAFAQTGEATTPAKSNFCTSIEQVSAKVSANIADREGKYTAKRDERMTTLSERYDKRDQTRSEKRDTWDSLREGWRAKLTARATTTAQKEAVTKFIADIDSAVATRRTAVDGAVASFRTAVEAAIKERQTAVDGALASFKLATDVALAGAKADCASGVAPKTVRTTYVTAMKAAREKLQTTIKGLAKKQDTLKAVADARRVTVQKAITDFKAAAQKAKLELKNVMISA